MYITMVCIWGMMVWEHNNNGPFCGATREDAVECRMSNEDGLRSAIGCSSSNSIPRRRGGQTMQCDAMRCDAPQSARLCVGRTISDSRCNVCGQRMSRLDWRCDGDGPMVQYGMSKKKRGWRDFVLADCDCPWSATRKQPGSSEDE